MAEDKKEKTSVAESSSNDSPSEKNIEEEIVIVKDIFKQDMDGRGYENRRKIVLKCLKCGFNDLCGLFISGEQNWTKDELEIEDIRLRINKEYRQEDTNERVFDRDVLRQRGRDIEREQFKTYFVCPKCKTSLIALDKKFVKNNIINGGGLSDEKDKDK